MNRGGSSALYSQKSVWGCLTTELAREIDLTDFLEGEPLKVILAGPYQFCLACQLERRTGPHQCPHCDEIFVDEGSLEKHMQKHLPVRHVEVVVDRWKVMWLKKPFEMRVPSGATVVGAVTDPANHNNPVLVLQREKEVVFQGLHGDHTVQFDSPLLEVQVSPATQLLAYRTDKGEIGVYSLMYKHFLLKVLS